LNKELVDVKESLKEVEKDKENMQATILDLN
jgi:hypothetical protein